jgi:ADP-heptose:LPS heptosyltransferase
MKKKKKVTRKPVAVRRPIIPNCKHFSGYKPCFPGTLCQDACTLPAPFGTRILLVNLDAMGNILVTTSILPAIKRKYPLSTITWLTEKNTAPLLRDNPLVDRVMAWDHESILVLGQMTFDVLMNVDKSRRAGAFAMGVKARKKFGFGMNENGQIIPLTREADSNFLLGLDDHKKFRLNRKTVAELQCEEFGLPFARDEYILPLSLAEKEFCSVYRRRHGLAGGELIVGFNTGCSELYPNKKMTIDQHVNLINRMYSIPGVKLVLVGGPEDTSRNEEIVRQAGELVHATPTAEGIRRGICYENLCDVIITGDSYGMHLAIALKKHVIVWFGVSCWPEIELYGRGIKLVPDGLECSPCWKSTCPHNLECLGMIDMDRIVQEVENQAVKHRAAPRHA